MKDDFATELQRRNRSKNTIDGYLVRIDYFMSGRRASNSGAWSSKRNLGIFDVERYARFAFG
ncbi:hypothetical protein ACFXG4_33415 [Nocardia sp. NPDC059246]|uniref:hypothetical protein n=1 Tax=unclassified Nocardia TaxID=2637762 RepID=UPI0036B30567